MNESVLPLIKSEAPAKPEVKPAPNSTRLLRIAITVDPEIPIPPNLYGGLERIVDMLVRGLTERGHEVTLFANPQSHAPCRLLGYPRLQSRGKLETVRNMWHVCSNLMHGDFDLVHSFGRLAYLAPVLPRSIPKIMSYGRAICARSVSLGNLLSRGTLHFTGCSANLIRRWGSRPNFHVVYNGVPMSTYHPMVQVDAGAPLVFLGRVERIKGAHLAIEVANRSNRALVLAGNIFPEHRQYFEQEIAPYVDGKRIQYVGPVNDEQKDRLLGRAVALLMPLLWEEPFGMVMTEAMACGTPVIGLRRGALAEIVEDGVTGFVCDTVDDMVRAVHRLSVIDRGTCRRMAEQKFSDTVIVADYERLYYAVLENRWKR